MNARECAVAIAIGAITVCLLIGSFVYLLFTSRWDIPETVSFAFVPAAFGYFGVRATIVVWRRRFRRMRVA